MIIVLLSRYLEIAKEKPAAFARRIGTHHSIVYRYLSGERTPSLRKALEIERLTQGRVRVQDWMGRGKGSKQ